MIAAITKDPSSFKVLMTSFPSFTTKFLTVIFGKVLVLSDISLFWPLFG